MLRFKTLSVVTATVLSNGAMAQAVAAAGPAKPNFVIILCDDLGYGDVGCFGNPTIHTPNIDRMATEGVKMTQFCVGAAVSTPSRGALLTGRLPVRSGVYGDREGVLFPDSKGGIPQDELTIARVLQQNGYTTGCVGKWHLGAFSPYLPTDHGFDSYFGIPYSNDMSPQNNPWGRAQTFPPTPLIEGARQIESEPDQGELTRRYTEKAVEFIREHADEPFFLYFAHTFPHAPLHTNDRFEGSSKRGLYGDVVQEIDWSVGEVLKALREQGIDENTLVIFTSDNGPWLVKQEHGGSAGVLREGKGTWWEGGFRVPAIARMPGKIAPRVSDGMVATMDLLPTFLTMADITLPKGVTLDGVDQSAMLLHEEASARDEMFYWWGSELMAVRKGPWKCYFKTLINPYTPEGLLQTHPEPLLYNVEEDLAERIDRSKEHPDVVTQLVKVAQAHKQTMQIKPGVCDL